MLANDPGSARIWSLDQHVLNAPAGSQLLENLNNITLASGAVISLNDDGTIHYQGTAAMQSLAEGEVFHESFIYTIRMANGALSTATAVVDITGVNDVAVFAGDTSGYVLEDGFTVTGGVLTISDVDHDQSAFAKTGELHGSYGDFGFNLATGEWSYTLRNADANVQALNSGATVQDKLEIFSVDGSSTQVVVDIAGSDETAIQGSAGPKWVVNPRNITLQGGGLDSVIAFDPSGKAAITGFNSAASINPTSLKFDGFSLVDTNADSTDDSTELFFHTSGHDATAIEITLVGYTSFSVEQFIH